MDVSFVTCNRCLTACCNSAVAAGAARELLHPGECTAAGMVYLLWFYLLEMLRLVAEAS